MATPPDKRRRVQLGATGEPRMRLSKRQELVLFVVLMLVLLGLVAFGMRA